MVSYYRLALESSVLPSTRAAAKRALVEASWHWGIPTPVLSWITKTNGPGPDVVKEYTGNGFLAGFCRTGMRPDGSWDWDIFLVGNLSLRETFKTTAHEICHLYGIRVGFGTWVSRDKPATEDEAAKAQEIFAERFAERFTKFNFGKR